MTSPARRIIVADVLNRAAYMINEDTWTHGEYARNEFGNPTEVTGDDACQFCALGAIIRAWYDISGADHSVDIATDSIPDLAGRVFAYVNGFHAPDYNDNHATEWQDVAEALESAGTFLRDEAYEAEAEAV